MEYQLTYAGLTLIPQNGYTVYMQEGGAGLPIREDSDLLTGRDGGVIHATRNGMRTLMINGTIFADNPEDFFIRRRALLNAFSRNPLKKPLTIQYWDGTVVTADATVITTPQWRDATGNRTQIQFTAHLRIAEGFFNLGGSSQTYTATPIAESKGFPIPFPLPIPIGLEAGGTSIVINNLGDGAVYPRFRLDGMMVNAQVTNVTTGQSFRINDTIPNGRFVEVYREGGDDYVMLDGNIPFYTQFSGSVFEVVPGNNTIQLSAGNSDADGLLTITYQDIVNGV